MKVKIIVLLVAGIIVSQKRNRSHRKKVVSRVRLEWIPHRERLLLEGQFKRYYRMSAGGFDCLLHLVTPYLQRVTFKSTNRTSMKPIEVVNMLQMTISWLAGGSYHSIRVLAGVSVPAFYSIVVDVMNAICDHERFRIIAPVSDVRDIEAAASSFAEISSNNILTGCIGCIDGWLCTIRAPSAKEVPDVSAFFSGHYLTYGINVQAMCDASCKFTGYSFNSPGKVSDSVALKKWRICTDFEKLPFGYFVIGDNAYTLAPSMLVPFTKPEIKSPEHSDYNFYLSQLRIRIEMAFGLLVNKWRIFQRALVVDYVHTGLVIKTCMKLHNYCVDDRLRMAGSTSSSQIILHEFNALEDCSYQHTITEETLNSGIKVKNGHILRQVVLEHIQNHNMTRP
eukprot:jgi/Phyca11/132225/e_gw1.143.13.1